MTKAKLKIPMWRNKKMIKQKLAGAILIAISVISCVVLKDGTSSVILTPIGIYTLVTKEDVMTDSIKNNEDIKR